MFKKIFILSLLILSTACKAEYSKICPKALIERNNAYLVIKSGYYEDFMIELIGHDGYCYFDKRVNHEKAVVSPIFKITRLRPTDVTDVMFSYYTETVKGPPEYLGKKTYFAKIHIPTEEKEIEYRAKQVEVRIPPEMKYQFDINLGMQITNEGRIYNQRTFDVPLGY